MSSMLAKMQELLVHHYNVSSAMGRDAAARGMGLNPEPYKHPYPGSTNNNYTFNMTVPDESKVVARQTETSSVPPVQTPPPQVVSSPPSQQMQQTQRSWWDNLWPCLLGLCLGTLPIAAFLVFGGLGQKAQIPPQPSNITNVDNVELEVRWRMGENGKWIPEVERVRKRD